MVLCLWALRSKVLYDEINRNPYDKMDEQKARDARETPE